MWQNDWNSIFRTEITLLARIIFVCLSTFFIVFVYLSLSCISHSRTHEYSSRAGVGRNGEERVRFSDFLSLDQAKFLHLVGLLRLSSSHVDGSPTKDYRIGRRVSRCMYVCDITQHALIITLIYVTRKFIILDTQIRYYIKAATFENSHVVSGRMLILWREGPVLKHAIVKRHQTLLFVQRTGCDLQHQVYGTCSPSCSLSFSLLVSYLHRTQAFEERNLVFGSLSTLTTRTSRSCQKQKKKP